jgi:hypothetical protein
MAITINGGTNAITGLAVGGLPDGSVDADTLAANAVVASKIAADAIDGTKISDDAIGNEHVAANAIQNAQVADDAIGVDELHATSGSAGTGTFFRGDGTWQAAGGGKILQIKRAATSSNLQTYSSSYSDVGVSLDITPSSTNSDFLILANFGVVRITQHTTASVYFKVLGGDSGTTQIDEWGTGWAFYTHADLREDRGYAAPTYITHVVNPNTTTQQTYKMQWRMENTTGSGAYLYSPRNLTVMEISGGYA